VAGRTTGRSGEAPGKKKPVTRDDDDDDDDDHGLGNFTACSGTKYKIF